MKGRKKSKSINKDIKLFIWYTILLTCRFYVSVLKFPLPLRSILLGDDFNFPVIIIHDNIKSFLSYPFAVDIPLRLY